MSETETRKGIITLVANSLKKFMSLKGFEIENEDELLDKFYDENYEESYIYANNKVYKIKKEVDVSYESIYEATELPNGDIRFLVQYYNGSEGFGEAVEQSIINMNKRMINADIS